MSELTIVGGYTALAEYYEKYGDHATSKVAGANAIADNVNIIEANDMLDEGGLEEIARRSPNKNDIIAMHSLGNVAAKALSELTPAQLIAIAGPEYVTPQELTVGAYRMAAGSYGIEFEPDAHPDNRIDRMKELAKRPVRGVSSIFRLYDYSTTWTIDGLPDNERHVVLRMERDEYFGNGDIIRRKATDPFEFRRGTNVYVIPNTNHNSIMFQPFAVAQGTYQALEQMAA